MRYTSVVLQGLEALFVDSLDPGQSPDPGQRYSMVSKGCSLIQVPRKRFREMAPPQTLDAIRATLVTYPSDVTLARHFVVRSHWDDYRRHVVQSVLGVGRQAAAARVAPPRRLDENRSPRAPPRGRSAQLASGRKFFLSALRGQEASSKQQPLAPLEDNVNGT